MGLKPYEVDRLTPAVFGGLWKQWRAINTRDDGEGGIDAPSDAEARAVREAELKWGSGS